MSGPASVQTAGSRRLATSTMLRRPLGLLPLSVAQARPRRGLSGQRQRVSVVSTKTCCSGRRVFAGCGGDAGFRSLILLVIEAQFWCPQSKNTSKQRAAGLNDDDAAALLAVTGVVSGKNKE